MTGRTKHIVSLITLLVFNSALMSFVTVCGCNRLSSDWTIHRVNGQPQPPIVRDAGERISRPCLLIADNQQHNIYSNPIIFRNPALKKLIPTAVRSAQLEFFGSDILRHIIGNCDLPVIHLGDACDFSCTEEFARFFRVMSSAAHGWVMAPGNHDGYFFGNTTKIGTNKSINKAIINEWEEACAKGGKPLEKDLFIRYYIAAQVITKPNDSAENAARVQLADHLGLKPKRVDALLRLGVTNSDSEIDEILKGIAKDIPPSGEWQYEYIESERPMLVAMSWNIDDEFHPKSWIVQEIDLSDPSHQSSVGTTQQVRGILLDTCNYFWLPNLVFWPAGIFGAVLKPQMDVITGWAQPASDKDTTWIAFGHHPISSISIWSRVGLNYLRQKMRSPLYISAHTHEGYYKVHSSGKDQFLELNLGSVLDWPIQYRTLTFYFDGDRVIMDVPRFQVTDTRITGDTHAYRTIWRPKPADCDWYQKNPRDSLHGEEQVKADRKTLLWMHHRMIGAYPTDYEEEYHCRSQHPHSDADVRNRIRQIAIRGDQKDMVDLLKKLAVFDECRPKQDEDGYVRYRLLQAIWASEHDSKKTIHTHRLEPRLNDRGFSFPRYKRLHQNTTKTDPSTP